MTRTWFTFVEHWRHAPAAFWVHVPVPGSEGLFEPPAPQALSGKGYLMLHVEFAGHEMIFSSPAQLEHTIAILAQVPLPTTRQLTALRQGGIGPNQHWLSRLPAQLKSPRKRAKLVAALDTARTTAHTTAPGPWR